MPSTPHMKIHFDDFLKKIRLDDEQKNALVNAHSQLRERLEADADLNKIMVSTFLQGSYRRSTIIKPNAGERSDVDVVVVTNLNEDEYSPSEALDLFEGFLEKTILVNMRGRVGLGGFNCRMQILILSPLRHPVLLILRLLQQATMSFLHLISRCWKAKGVYRTSMDLGSPQKYIPF